MVGTAGARARGVGGTEEGDKCLLKLSSELETPRQLNGWGLQRLGLNKSNY